MTSKRACLAALCVSLLLTGAAMNVEAKKQRKPPPPPPETTGISSTQGWQMGMFPHEQYSPEQMEVNRWSPLIKTADAEFDFEDASIDEDEKDANLVFVNLKVFYLKTARRAEFDDKYAAQLSGDRFSHLEQFYAFHRNKRDYAVIRTRVISFGNVKLDETETALDAATFTPIAKGSVEELALDKVEKFIGSLDPTVEQN